MAEKDQRAADPLQFFIQMPPRMSVRDYIVGILERSSEMLPAIKARI
jgi:hypothetical protein